MNWLVTGKSTNMQNSSFSKNEEFLLSGFNSLCEEDKEELIEILQMKLHKTQKGRVASAKSSGLMSIEKGNLIG